MCIRASDSAEQLADSRTGALVGEAEELAAISPSDVIAQVDASAQNITVKGSGQQQFSAQIIVTGTKTVFATGAYSVLCDITVK